MTKEDINTIIGICDKNYPKEDIEELSEFQDGARSAINLIKADILSNPLEHLVIPQKLLKQIAKIMEIEVDFTNKKNNDDYPPMDKFGLLAYLKDDFMNDNQFNAEKIVKIVRLLDKNNIPIENLKFLSV